MTPRQNDYETRQAAFNEALMGQDELGAIIRAHIHIEHELIQFIEKHLKVPKALKDMQLDYNARIHLALALGLKPSLSSPLKAVGTLRSAFAHKLGAILSEGKAKDFYKSFDAEGKRVLQQAYNRTHQQLGTAKPPKVASLGPKDLCILCLVVIWAALIAAQPVEPSAVPAKEQSNK